jgi:hypothetical protein
MYIRSPLFVAESAVEMKRKFFKNQQPISVGV